MVASFAIDDVRAIQFSWCFRLLLTNGNFFVVTSFAIDDVGAIQFSWPVRLLLTNGNFFVVASFAIYGLRTIQTSWPVRLLLTKRHAEQAKQFARFVIGLRRRDNRHVHTLDLVHLCVVDLRKDQLIAKSKRVVSTTVE